MDGYIDRWMDEWMDGQQTDRQTFVYKKVIIVMCLQDNELEK